MMLLKNTLFALLAGASVALPATAQGLKTAGDLEFYGRAHFSIDALDDGADYNRLNGSSNSSYLGLRGGKSFGDIRAVWQVEQEIFFNLNGANNDAINRFATRDTFAGLEGRFGRFRFGKFDTPFKVARGPANLFGDQVGDLRNVTRVGSARFDERLNNTLEYRTPTFNGFTATLAYALHEGSSAATVGGVDKRDSAVSAALQYKAGNLDAALAWEDYGKDAANGDRDAIRLAVGYKATKDLRLVGFYQNARHATDGGTVAGFGAEYAILPQTFLRAHVFKRSADKANADATLYAIGVERQIDSQLRLYVSYAQVGNDPAANLTPWVQGRSTAQAGVAGKDAHAISFGVRYDF